MFNKIKTKSLSSKNDEFLKTICNDENNKNTIISKAIKKCKLRVVVKTSKHSKNEFLKPDYDVSTKLIKYNIYNGSYK
jgi:4-hydroxy-3-methylbut-2-enyl diphosphate reductase IspH